MHGELKEICRKVYREAVQAGEIPTELKRALKTHERVPAFIDNLSRELSEMKPAPTRELIERTVREMTAWFVSLVKRAADEKALSPLQQTLHKSETERGVQLEKVEQALSRSGGTYAEIDEETFEAAERKADTLE